MRFPRARIWLRAGIVLLVVAGSGFALREFRRTHSVSDLPSAPARHGDFLVMVRCRGELTARRSVQLTAPVNATDLQIVWLAPSGSEVRAGQPVIRFDPSKSQQELKEKTAALEQAQATLDQAVAQSRITADQDRLDLAAATYAMEKARLEGSKQAIVSPMDAQKSAIDLGLAQEKVKVQQATNGLHAKSDEAKIASQQRLRDQARAEVDLIKRRLALMEVRSPLNGIVTYLPNLSQGWMNAQPFKVGDHASPGLAIAEIPDLSTLEMESKVDEVDRGRIALGDAVLVHVDALPEKVLNAKLVSISPLTEQSFNEWPPTQTFRAFARIDQPDSRMRPGMNAGADIIQQKIPNAISVPARALFTVGGNPTLYTKTAGLYIPQRVKVLARNPDEVAVTGIAAGTPVALVEPVGEKR